MEQFHDTSAHGDNELVLSFDNACLSQYIEQLRKQAAFWKTYSRTSPTWASFSPTNNDPVNLEGQQLCCIICHGNTIFGMQTRSRSTVERKGILTCKKGQGSSHLLKYVQLEHRDLLQEYEIVLTLEASSANEKQVSNPRKKRLRVQGQAVTKFFGQEEHYGSEDMKQKQFLEDLVLMCVKGLLPLSIAENLWFKRLALQLDPLLVFPSRKTFCSTLVPSMLKQCMDEHVHPYLKTCISCSLTFDLWMSRKTQDVFVLIVNFISDNWEPKHITVGFFEANDTTGATLANQLDHILQQYGLQDKILCLVKDEGSNLSTMSTAMKRVLHCEALGLDEPFEGSCFGHAMAKACQYGTSDERVCDHSQTLSIQGAQACIQSCITWPKKSGKGRKAWLQACRDSGLNPRMLSTPVKTRFASRVIMFKEVLQYRPAIHSCYIQQTPELQQRIPSAQVWAVADVVVQSLSPVLKACILNQKRGYWLLSDALSITIDVYLKLQLQMVEMEAVVMGSSRQDFSVRAALLGIRIRQQVLKVLDPFLTSLQSFKKCDAHNMFALMLDPRFKDLELLCKFLGKERAHEIAEEYNNHCLVPQLVKIYQRLNPREDPTSSHITDRPVVYARPLSPYAIAQKCVLQELECFRWFQIFPQVYKNASNALVWWKSHASQFPTVSFLARQILGIPGSQIECERVFSVAGILTGLRRCRLGVTNLQQLILLTRNWPDDPGFGVDSSIGSLEDYIEKEANLLDEMEEEFQEDFFSAIEQFENSAHDIADMISP